jgi:hypothetical protein
MIRLGVNQAMNQAEALRVLRLDKASDGRAVEQSYWSLVHRAQSRGDDPRAQREIERLNEAYALLAPHAEPMAATKRRAPAAEAPTPSVRMSQGVLVPDAILGWLGRESGRVSARWSGRNPELALICGAGLVLVVLAVAAGSSILPVLICVAVIAGAVWSPWRGRPPTR